MSENSTGLRVVSVFDRLTTGDEDRTSPRIAPDRERLDEATAARVADYMDGCRHLLRTGARSPDLLDPDSDADVVPMSTRSDGVFVWSDASTFYVRHYRVSPGQEFVDHCAAADHRPPVIGDARAAELVAAWMAR